MSTPTHKTCTECGKSKAPGDFYAGRAVCRDCYNAKPKRATPTRVNRNRARHRAIAELIAAHPDEFEQLMERCLAEAREEAESLAESPAAAEHYRDEPVRLRSGPRRSGEKAGDRIDVARCPHCVKHHDRGHVCAKCGAAPAAALRLPDDGEIDEIAVERAMDGDAVRLTDSERLEAIRRLVERGASDADIARRLHVSSQTVLRWRQEHSIDTRWSA